MNSSKLVSASTVAASTGRGVSTVYRLAAQRRIPCVRIGRSVLFDPVAVAEYVDRPAREQVSA